MAAGSRDGHEAASTVLLSLPASLHRLVPHASIGAVSQPFDHAVASFDPTSTGVLLWTRLSGGESAADLVVARDPDLHDVVHRSTHQTGPDRDHTVVVAVEELEPATTYWYQFLSAGCSSPVGRTRTLPDGVVERVRIGLVCCANYSVAPLGVYRALAEREVDLVLHLGDYMYEDRGAGGVRDDDPPRATITLADYRRRLAQLRADPDTQALHLRHAVTTIWDDHDLSDNAWHSGAKHHDPDRDGPWIDRVRAAAQARQEWVPRRLMDPSNPLRTWQSVTLGDLAELVLLDTRYEGRDRQAGDDGALALDDPGRSLLGEPQRAWAEARLREAEQPWAVVVSGVVVNELELPWPIALSRVNALLPNGYAVIDGRVMHDDQWDGYPRERERLARWCRDRAESGRRTVLLSGDVHSSWAFVGPDDPATPSPVAVEFTVPAVSSAAMGRAHFPGLSVLLDRAVDRMDHVSWAEVTRRGYCILELTPDRAQAEWWFVQPYDEDPAASAELGAAFVTDREAWPPALVETKTASSDPSRPGLPDGLPARPSDLEALRRQHKARILRRTFAVLVPVVAGATLWATGARRRGHDQGRPSASSSPPS